MDRVSDEHNRRSARIDALSVAQVYGITTTQLALALGHDSDALRTDPTQESIQTGLRSLAEAWNQLEDLFANRERIACWLQQRMQRGGRRPLDILTDRNGAKPFTQLVGRIVTGTYR